MKFLLMLSLTLVAASAMACPDLTGTYQCQKDPDDSNDSGIISIAMANGGYTWISNDDPSNQSFYPTDGKINTAPDGSTFAGSCTDTAFNITIAGADPQFGQYKWDMTISLDAQSNLNQKGILAVGGQTQPMEETCTRIN